jgi:hypothetical protein
MALLRIRLLRRIKKDGSSLVAIRACVCLTLIPSRVAVSTVVSKRAVKTARLLFDSRICAGAHGILSVTSRLQRLLIDLFSVGINMDVDAVSQPYDEGVSEAFVNTLSSKADCSKADLLRNGNRCRSSAMACYQADVSETS